MDATMQQYLMYAIAAVIGYLIKHFFPQLPPLPSPAPMKVELPPILTMNHLDEALDAAFRRHLPGAK